MEDSDTTTNFSAARRSKLQCFMLSNLQRKTSSAYLKLDARLARLAHRTCEDSGSNEYHKNPDEIRELLFLMTHYMCMLAKERQRWKKIYIDRLHYQTTGLRCRRSVRKLALWQHTKEEKNIVTLIFCVFMEIKFFSTLLTLPTLDTYFISFTARAAADRTDAMCVFLDIRVNKLKLFSI